MKYIAKTNIEVVKSLQNLQCYKKNGTYIFKELDKSYLAGIFVGNHLKKFHLH